MITIAPQGLTLYYLEKHLLYFGTKSLVVLFESLPRHVEREGKHPRAKRERETRFSCCPQIAARFAALLSVLFAVVRVARCCPRCPCFLFFHAYHGHGHTLYHAQASMPTMAVIFNTMLKVMVMAMAMPHSLLKPARSGPARSHQHT